MERAGKGGEGDVLKISAHDDGDGVPEDMRERLFGIYGLGEARTGGTGIGLASVKSQSEALEGSCGVDQSAMLGGAHFWIKLPHRAVKPTLSRQGSPAAITTAPDGSSEPVTATATTTATATATATATTTPIKQEQKVKQEKKAKAKLDSPKRTLGRVLVVDDAVLIRRIVESLLKKKGYEVDLAKNGREGLEMMKLRSYHLVLSDVQMPVKDGYDMVKEFRRWEAEQAGEAGGADDGDGGSSRTRQRIVFMSANCTKKDVQAAYETGVDVFLPKPVGKKDLERVL